MVTMRKLIMDFEDETVNIKGAGQETLAKVIPRVIGYVIDRIIIWGTGIMITWAMSIILDFEMFKLSRSPIDSIYRFNPLQGLFSLTIFIIVFLMDIFMAYMLYKTNGFTPGKLAMKVRAVKKDGSALTFSESVTRELMIKGIGNALTSGIVNIISLFAASFSNERKALHDMSVGTVVIKVSV